MSQRAISLTPLIYPATKVVSTLRIDYDLDGETESGSVTIAAAGNAPATLRGGNNIFAKTINQEAHCAPRWLNQRRPVTLRRRSLIRFHLPFASTEA